MDLLELTDVSELLGESDATILLARDRFPEYVPTVGHGANRRFPSIALDVLRLITDAMAAGAPSDATIHLLETHFPPNALAAAAPDPGDVPADNLPDPAAPAERSLHIAAATLLEQQDGLIREATDRQLAELRRLLDAAVVPIGDEIHELRAELVSTARRTDLEAIQAETRALIAARSPDPDTAPDLDVTLRPLRDAIGKLTGIIHDLRAEVATLRAQIARREQVSDLAVAVADLRAQVQAIAFSEHRPGDYLRPIANSSDGDEMAPAGPPIAAGDDRRLDDRQDALNGHGANGTTDATDPIEASGTITRLAARTPRRMGRALLADEI